MPRWQSATPFTSKHCTTCNPGINEGTSILTLCTIAAPKAKAVYNKVIIYKCSVSSFSLPLLSLVQIFFHATNLAMTPGGVMLRACPIQSFLCTALCTGCKSEGQLHIYRSTDGSRAQQVSRFQVATTYGVVSQLLFHSPVHVLQ